MIWWLWTAFDPVIVNIFDIDAAWQDEDPDVYWLGESAWTDRFSTVIANG